MTTFAEMDVHTRIAWLQTNYIYWTQDNRKKLAGRWVNIFILWAIICAVLGALTAMRGWYLSAGAFAFGAVLFATIMRARWVRVEKQAAANMLHLDNIRDHLGLPVWNRELAGRG